MTQGRGEGGAASDDLTPSTQEVEEVPLFERSRSSTCRVPMTCIYVRGMELIMLKILLGGRKEALFSRTSYRDTSGRIV